MDICNCGSTPVPDRTNRDIADQIRLRVIHAGLELEEIGIELADVTDDVPLFDIDGLNLDSIDALEILAGVQREFGLSLPDVDQAFMNEHCSTVGRLARLVESMSAERGVRGREADAGTRGQASDARIGDGSPTAVAEARLADPAADSRGASDGSDT